MLNKKVIKLLTHIFILLFLAGLVINVEAQTKTLTDAVQLFNEGNYNKAMPVFKRLLEEDSENSMLNFYYGASRTESGFFSEMDLNHLLKGKSDSVPLIINYYLGIQYQAQNNWDEALKYYNRFRINTPKEQQDNLTLTEKIQQCYNQENPYTLTESIEPAPQLDTIHESDSVIFTEDSPTIIDSTEFQPNPKNVGIPIEFQVNNEITYLYTSHFKTEKGRELFEKAYSLQKELDNSLAQMEKLRSEYRSSIDANEKKTIGEKILSLENESYELKENITQLLLQARDEENVYWQNATQQEIMKFNRTLQEMTTNNKEESPVINESQDSINTSLILDSDLLLGNTETAPIVAEPENKDELIYKIQIGAYSRGLPTYVDRLFKKLSLIRKIENYTDEKGVVVYTTGNLKNIDDAVKMQKQVRQEGVEDAFVVPYFNGKRITLEQAKKIEAGL